MQLKIPEFGVVALIGATGSGKTTFAHKHFKSTEILSSDYFRSIISDDMENQEVTKDAFDSLYYVANKRLDHHKLTVIDATNVQKNAREQVLALAKGQDCFATAIVLDIPKEVCKERNAQRTDRKIPSYIVDNHVSALKRSLRYLKKEGFRRIYVLTPEDLDQVEIVREPLWTNRKEDHGPFDIIGDIHGCYEELCELLEAMEYQVDRTTGEVLCPPNRKAVFLGDLCDRGPGNVPVLKLVMGMVEKEQALCVLGNHDAKLLKYLSGTKVRQTHGIESTIEELNAQPEEFRLQVKNFLQSLISHYVLDDGNLVVVHAGLKEKYQGRSSGRVRSFAIYGETTGEMDEYGYPVRLNWAEEYRGKALVLYGHTAALEPQFLNNTICIDTGCVFGGKLTAYRYPEDTFEEVLAKKVYYASNKPLDVPEDQRHLLRIGDVTGKRVVSTRLYKNITIGEGNSAAALETISRFAVDPRWLIYLPPTMSPCETSEDEEYLENPREAFGYYWKNQIFDLVCERKHMGSRAVIVLCRTPQVAEKRFGVDDGSRGVIYTRTGRSFFPQKEIEEEILSRLNVVLEKTQFWEHFSTDWICLDSELLPWSAKAQDLLISQYAPVGRAGRDGASAAVSALEKATKRSYPEREVESTTSGQNLDLNQILEEYRWKEESLEHYTDAYREYCWPVDSVDDYRIAPFHILATEDHVWNDKTHMAHLSIIEQYMTGIDPLFMATDFIRVNLREEQSVQNGKEWWNKVTQEGGEGMVVKPNQFLSYWNKKLLQPAVKCRGREYLRIIYGPEYLWPDNLKRLKKRSLKRKQQLAMSEFALGMESLERFVNYEPLYRIHEPVFGVLALESEAVDPRL